MIEADGSLRCDGCGKKVGVSKIKEGRFEWVCPRCKRFNVFQNLTSSDSYATVNSRSGILST